MNVTKGLTKEDFVAQTFCDFGDRTRKTEIRRHYDYSAAKKAFGEIANVYTRGFGRTDNNRVWQETRQGTILNDTHKIMNLR